MLQTATIDWHLVELLYGLLVERVLLATAAKGLHLHLVCRGCRLCASSVRLILHRLHDVTVSCFLDHVELLRRVRCAYWQAIVYF